MNPRGITFYSESNPKAAKAANKKSKVEAVDVCWSHKEARTTDC